MLRTSLLRKANGHVIKPKMTFKQGSEDIDHCRPQRDKKHSKFVIRKRVEGKPSSKTLRFHSEFCIRVISVTRFVGDFIILSVLFWPR